MNILDFLANISLFKGLPPAHITSIAQFITTKKYNKNEEVFFEGQKASSFYIVYSGKVKVYKVSSQGKEQILRVMHPSDIIAHVPIFEGDNYPASCTAIAETVLLSLARDKLIKLIKDEPQLALNLLAIQSKRLRELTNQIENLAVKDTTQRLIKYILERCDVHESCELDLSLSSLANLLGVTRENLSRTVSKMVKLQLITHTDKQIKILSIERLKKMLI